MALLVPPPFYPCDPRTVVLSLISAVLCFVGWYFSSFCDVAVGVGLVKLLHPIQKVPQHDHHGRKFSAFLKTSQNRFQVVHGFSLFKDRELVPQLVIQECVDVVPPNGPSRSSLLFCNC